MAIRPTDAKRLWGRSGARCTICRRELSSIGSDAVLGEIAHIIAQSSDGPRGEASLFADDRDRYPNLMLLCPTHHQVIDADPATWTVEKLHHAKAEHEGWVERMLDQGAIQPAILDTTQFREARVAEWSSSPHSWSFVSLTPLELSDDAVDPLAGPFRSLIQSTQFPELLGQTLGFSPNPYHLEPTAAGLVAENFSRLGDGVAYRIEVFRTGHIEYAACLDEALTRYDLNELVSRPAGRLQGLLSNRREECQRVLSFHTWAKVLQVQVGLLHSLWQNGRLPFRDMVLTASLTNVHRVCLLVVYGNHNARLGRAAEASVLRHAIVSPATMSADEAVAVVISRLVNAFGLDLPVAYDEQGALNLPQVLGQSRSQR